MKKALVLLLVVLVMVGCQNREAQEPEVDRSQLALQLIQQGSKALQDGDPVGGVKAFGMAVSADPQNSEGYFLLAQTFIRLNEHEQAVKVLEQAVDQFPENGLFYYLLSLSNNELDRKLPAVLAARKSAELYSAQNNQENLKRSLALLNTLVEDAKQTEQAKAE